MSEVKVNKISPRSGTEVTLGDSGDTFTIPSGATINNQGTATNFGATGAASWDTTVKTASFTGVAGVGYFVDTTSGAITVTLPASPDAGAVVAVKDYAGTFDTNALTLGRNGSKIGGDAVDGTLTTEGIAVTLVFIDSTQGWLVTDSGLQSESPTRTYITATGGTITCSGDYKIHTFTGPGTFCVSGLANPSGGPNTMDYLVVAGGGSSTGAVGSGGGAGGFRLSNATCMPAPLTSPLASPTGITATITSYPIVVGGGGAAPSPASPTGTKGSVSSGLGISSAGGGAGKAAANDGACMTGGSGSGGAGEFPGSVGPAGAGNTPPVSPPQGNNGGTGGQAPTARGGGGGGGAGAVGSTGSGSGGNGGAGSFIVQSGFAGCNGTSGPVSSTKYFAGGGGGGFEAAGGSNGSGGAGGGGAAGCGPNGQGDGKAGTTNTGGGGGGGSRGQPGTNLCQEGGNGGSGIVIIRYKFQN